MCCKFMQQKLRSDMIIKNNHVGVIQEVAHYKFL
jgi:hypothetical protein